MFKGKKMLEALLDELDKHSEYTNAKIQRGIDENRKGLFLIRLHDKSGKEISVDKVHIKQKKHEFKFGAPLFVLDQLDSEENNKKYEEKFKNIFNYAVMPMYHRDVELEPGEYRFDKDSQFIWRRPPLDTVVNFCKENSLRMKAHCLVYNSFNPLWFSEMSNREININIDKYIQAISERYKYDILDMDVINEMYTIYKNAYVGNGCRDLSVTDENDHVTKMFFWAKKYFPHTNLFWNEGSFETFGNDIYKGPRSTYYMMLKEQIEKGTPIGGVGIQYHLYATVGTNDGEEKAYRGICNPLRIFDALDCYSKFNLPIHISEISVPSYSNDTEAEKLQAIITKRLYSIFFAQKNVESMVWWNLCDKMAYNTESDFHTGLLRDDLSEKPAYTTLNSLINHEWNTELVTNTNKNGLIEFEGFYGDYEISYEHDGVIFNKSVSLHREKTGFDNRLLEPREIFV